jgi:hypothetical protein
MSSRNQQVFDRGELCVLDTPFGGFGQQFRTFLLQLDEMDEAVYRPTQIMV